MVFPADLCYIEGRKCDITIRKGGNFPMFKDNLLMLRKAAGLSQEELAEKLDISRQTLSKYETGESLPDIEKCRMIADVFNVSLDDLVTYEPDGTGLGIAPKGRHMFGVLTVGEKGQIIIPAKARRIFNIHPGDSLILLGDEAQGLALIKEADLMILLNQNTRWEEQ